MSPSDARWLNIWEWVASIGFFIVIVGVVIEGVEHFRKFPRKDKELKEKWEKSGWFLVVAGLALEFLGDHAAKRISDRESARLTKEAEDSHQLAVKFDADRVLIAKQAEEIKQTNLVLQIKLREIEAKLEWRHITDEQQKQLIACLNGASPKGKGSIVPKVFDEEAERFAAEITDVLRRSGFEIAPNPGARPFSWDSLKAGIIVKDSDAAPPHGGIIQACFGKAGIKLDGFSMPDMYNGTKNKYEANTVIIAIGARGP
jgi:hypothetical protein